MHKLLCIAFLGLCLVASVAPATAIKHPKQFDDKVLQLLKGAQEQSAESLEASSASKDAAQGVSLLSTGSSVDLATSLQRYV